MRVLLVGTGVQPIPPVGYGGVERTIAEYAAALQAAGHEAVVLNEVRRGRMRDEFPFARSLESRLRNLEFDILHASTPVVASALARHRRRFVYTSHSRHWFDRHSPTDWWGYHVERRAVRSAAASVALTKRLAEVMVASAGAKVADRVEVIPIGVDSDRFRPDWAIRTGRVALGVGAVIRPKRWDVAARALRGLDVDLRVVGPAPDPEYAQEVRAAGPRTTVVGEVDEAALIREFASADFLIHPSKVEVLPGVVLQAFASALPVLGGPAIAPLVAQDQTGWCATTDVDPVRFERYLGERAEFLLDDASLRRRTGEAARQVAQERYAWSRVVDMHLQLYQRVLAGGPPTRRGSLGP